MKIKCPKSNLAAVQDTMDVLKGRWKIAIIAALCYDKMRFSDLQKEIEGVSAKMLSSELKDLEINQLVKRTVLSKQPISVEYELTEYGWTLKKIIEHLAEWGIRHRKQITGKVLEY
ncbi:DNA-binding HxlR family transcriptional regulator [Epilithonimonas hungarica]|uniref:winged helix-turn-helix transcriptional regulator n=1 Tax=Epilithonimonas hungarica TaxID=454006 RepID=UPI0027878A15|nr:helix-turn-helix domain-containing protein [Epilithonimonas hungarica]MDP9957738.1 DNA-binding HxlR family transcriptional regulator [Epilithonimonas hungarica]